MHLFPKRASLRGLESEIFKLVSYGATPEQWAEWLRVPLEHAAVRGNLDLVNMLIEAGADGSSGWRGCRGRTLLDAAALGGSAGVVAALLRAGARPDVKVVSMSPQRSALYVATMCGHVEAAESLIVAGADVDFQDPVRQNDVLHEAAIGGHEQLVNELLIGGADPHRRVGRNGGTALHVAAAIGQVEIVSNLLFLAGADKDALDRNGRSALMWAATHGRLNVVETLIKTGADVNIRCRPPQCDSALHAAARAGHVSVLKAILEQGANVDSCNGKGRNALHAAAEWDQASAIDALIEAGASIELKSTKGRTPLFCAALFNQRKAMLTLLRHGAIVSTCDDDGRTPLHQVCMFKDPGLESGVDLLLRWGANETALDTNGETPARDLDKPRRSVGGCPPAEIERARLLLARAPADRAWRRRCWLTMLRSRSTKAEADGDEIGGEAGGASNQAGGRPGKSLENDKTEGTPSLGYHRDIHGQPCDDGDKVGAGAKGAELSGVVTFLVDLEVKDVFRTVVGFL
ncbi:unnamed protein product [Ectocarpus fasciculatus]